MKNIRIRKVQVEVKGELIEFEEKYIVNEVGEEIFDRDIEIENDQRLYDIYKKRNNLLTIEEIKKIREKYELTQKDYALIIGVGEITVHRFEKGSIQTEAVDSIMRLSEDPDNMNFLFKQNKNNISKELQNKLKIKIEELQQLKKHRLIDKEDLMINQLEHREISATILAEHIIHEYNNKVDNLCIDYEIIPEYITNLKLQKLLYYVQGISLLVFGKKAFPEEIKAWIYGPVVNEVYQNYKDNHGKEIILENDENNINKIPYGTHKIVETVVSNYGSMEANKLIDFTHEEDPWKNTEINKEIKVDLIKEYFEKVYN